MARIKYEEAAGQEVKRGKPPIGKKPEKKELRKLSSFYIADRGLFYFKNYIVSVPLLDKAEKEQTSVN